MRIKKISFVIPLLLWALSNCTTFELKEPANNQLGGIAISLFYTQGKGTLFEVNEPIYNVELMEQQDDGSFKKLALPERQTNLFAPARADSVSVAAEHVFVNLDPRKTYALSYAYTYFTIDRTLYEVPIHFDPKETAETISFRPEPGKIKYYGVYMIENVVLEKGNIFQLRGEDSQLQIKPGLDQIKSRFLNKTYGMIFGAEPASLQGAEKHLLKAFIPFGVKNRWIEIMKNRLEELG